MAAETKEANEANPPVHLNILETIKVAQNQHGVRHDDYLRYRQYCARRLRRLRVGLGFLHGKKEFKKKTIEPKHVTSDVRYLHLLLMNAERSWSYAMMLKRASETEVDESNETLHPRYKFHWMRKLAKAVKWSTELKTLCLERADLRTQIEAEAYESFHRGNYMLDKGSYLEASKYFEHANQSYAKLAEVSSPEDRTLFQERAASLEPSIRFANYMKNKDNNPPQDASQLLDMQKGLDDSLRNKLQHMHEELRKGHGDAMSTVLWHGSRLGVKEGRTRNSLVEAQEILQSLSKDESKDVEAELSRKMEIYGKALQCYDDALQHIREEMRETEKSGKAAVSKGGAVQGLVQLKDYISFQKLLCVSERNFLLSINLESSLRSQEKGQRPKSKKVKPDDLVNLFTRMIQGVNEMAGFAGGDSKMKADLDAQTSAFTALRCFYLAGSYKSVSKFAEAYVLYQRSFELAQAAVEAQKKRTSPDAQLSTRLEQLLQQSQGAKYGVHAAYILSSFEDAKKTKERTVAEKKDSDKEAGFKGGKTLLERLDSFDAGDPAAQFQLVEFPPNFVPVPCKPILFDLAYNFIEFQPITNRFPATAPTAAEQKSTAPASKTSAKPGAAPAKPPPPAAASSSAKPKEEPKKPGGWLSFLGGRK